MAIHNAGVFILVFCTGGQAQLERNGEAIWYSDDDEEFIEEITDEFLKESDHKDVLEFLVEKDILTEDQAAECEIEVESLDEDGDDDEDDEDDDSGGDE